MEVELNRTGPSHAVMEEALFPQRSIPCCLLVNRTSHTQARSYARCYRDRQTLLWGSSPAHRRLLCEKLSNSSTCLRTIWFQ